MKDVIKNLESMGAEEFKNAEPFHENREYWETLESVVGRFEVSWNVDHDIDLMELLLEVDDLFRKRILVELVKLDQEKRWSCGCTYLLEWYLSKWPILKDSSKDLAGLLKSECQIRLAHNDPPSVKEIESRFPGVFKNIEVHQVFSIRDHPINNELQFLVSTPLIESISNQNVFRMRDGKNQVLSRGRKLGRYQVLSVLGRGGMGIVYLAKDDELDRLVAVKLLHPWFFGNDGELSLLLKEARTAAKIKHAAILPIYDFGTASDGAHYFVMEYVDGCSLDQLIKNGDLNPESSVAIMMQVGDALELAHQEGIIHRDIKPANILIDSRGSARVTDFGLAFHQKDQRTNSEIAGTLPYMSPQQVSGNSDQIDKRTDVWSLGVVFYEMLTQARPFNEKTFENLSVSIQTNDPVAPSKIKPGVSKELDRICLRCLQKEPANRYPDARQLVDDLRFWRETKLNRRVPRFIATCVVLLLAGFALWGSFNFANNSGDKICPWLKQDCKLVLNFQTGVTVDIENAKRSLTFFGDLIESLNKEPYFSGNRILEIHDDPNLSMGPPSHLTDPNWLCWEMPIAVNYQDSFQKVAENEGELPRANPLVDFDPASVSLRLRFAVNGAGDFQVGTISTNGVEEEHLLVLAQLGAGIPNYADPPEKANRESIDAIEYLSKQEYGSPQDPFLAVDARQTILAEFAVGVYRSFMKNEYIVSTSGAPYTNAEIFQKTAFYLENYFRLPITVVDGHLFHQNLNDLKVAKNYAQNKEAIFDLALAQNSRWSPLTRQTKSRDFNNGNPSNETWNFDLQDDRFREYAKLGVVTKFQVPEHLTSVLSFSVSSDNRNSARLSISGLNKLADKHNFRQMPYGGEFDRNSISLNEEKPEIIATSFNISRIDGIFYNRSFKQIEMAGLLHWSTLRTSYRYVVFGNLNDDQIGESIATAKIFPVVKYDPKQKQNSQFRPTWEPENRKPIEKSSREINPQIWVIPSSRN